MGQLEGKVAVITGGASGIGAATAALFAAEGASVMVGDIQDDVGERFAAELGEQAAYQHCNVSSEAEIESLVRGAAERFGGLHVLFNNAGFGGTAGPIETTPLEEYDHTMNVLLRGVFAGIKHAAPIMKEQGSGSIISTSSVCGLQPGIGPHVYTIAKAGVVMLTKSAALELGESGVRVNCICPGYIATPLAAGRPLSQHEADDVEARLDRVRDRVADSQALRRMGEGRDIAQMALFLASDASEWVTGTAQVVDGGLLLGKPWRKLPHMITERRQQMAPTAGG